MCALTSGGIVSLFSQSSMLASTAVIVVYTLSSDSGTFDRRQFGRGRDETRRTGRNIAGVIYRPLSCDRSFSPPAQASAIASGAKGRPRLTRAAKHSDPKDNLKPQERIGIGICLALLVEHTSRYIHLHHRHDLQSHYTKPSEACTPPSMPPVQLK